MNFIKQYESESLLNSQDSIKSSQFPFHDVSNEETNSIDVSQLLFISLDSDVDSVKNKNVGMQNTIEGAADLVQNVEVQNAIQSGVDLDENVELQDTIQKDVEFIDPNIEGSSANHTESLVWKDKKKSRQLRRNSGQEYVSLSGKVVAKRYVKTLSSCRLDCKSKVSYQDQLRIFNSHYSKGTYEHRCDSVTSLVQVRAKKEAKGKNKKIRKYSVQYQLTIESGRVNVCKKCFLNTLGETPSFVYSVLDRSWKAMNKSFTRDLRGKRVPKNRTSEEKVEKIRKHLEKIPYYESHYSRSHTSNKYFPIDLDMAKMYKLYRDETQEPVSRKVYKKFCNEHMRQNKINFKPPHRDCCHKCVEYVTKLKYESDLIKRQQLEEERNIHEDMAELAYKEKKKDKEKAIASKGSFIMCSFDLQQCLPCPLLHTSVSFYKRKLWVYNLTIHSTSKNTECYMWHEADAYRGSNEVASCLEKSISGLDPSITHAVYWSDCCSGQNKNKMVVTMFSTLVANHPTLETLDHKFLVPGHAHMENDSDHAVIEKAKKLAGDKIQHPSDWYNLVRNAETTKPFEVIVMTQDDFYNYENLYSEVYVMRHQTTDKQAFNWKDVRWVRYTKQQGILYFKNSFSESEPFLELNIRRRDQTNFVLDSKRMLRYHKPVPINVEKKKDLMDLLPLLSPDVREFYRNLDTDERLANYDPDLEVLAADQTNNDAEVSNNQTHCPEEVTQTNENNVVTDPLETEPPKKKVKMSKPKTSERKKKTTPKNDSSEQVLESNINTRKSTRERKKRFQFAGEYGYFED